MDILHNLNALGLIFDGVGVTILGVPSLLESAKDTHRESGTYWDSNEPLMNRLIRTKFDTSVGSVFLIVGFALQLLATLQIKIPSLASYALAGVVVVGPLAYFLVFRHRWVENYAAAVKRMSKPESGQ